MGEDTVGPEAIEIDGPVDAVDALEVVFDAGEEVLFGFGELDVLGQSGGVDGGDSHEAVVTGALGVEVFVHGGGGVVGGEWRVFVGNGTPDGVDGTGGGDAGSGGGGDSSNGGGATGRCGSEGSTEIFLSF